MASNEKREDLLNHSIINDFREVLNSSNIFCYEIEYKKNWNLFCAMMDRIDSCVDYINGFDVSRFQTEESLINFVTYCSIIFESIIQLFINVPELKLFYKQKISDNELDEYISNIKRLCLGYINWFDNKIGRP